MTYFVQAILCDKFQDFYVTANSAADAIAQVRKLVKGTTLDNRFTRFAI